MACYVVPVYGWDFCGLVDNYPMVSLDLEGARSMLRKEDRRI